MDNSHYTYQLIRTFPQTLDQIMGEIDSFFQNGLPQHKSNAARYTIGLNRLFSTINPLEFVQDSFLRELGEYLPALQYVAHQIEPSDVVIRPDIVQMIAVAKYQCETYIHLTEGKALQQGEAITLWLPTSNARKTNH